MNLPAGRSVVFVYRLISSSVNNTGLKYPIRVNAFVNFDDLSLTLLKHFPNLTVTLHDLILTGKGRMSRDTILRASELDIEIRTLSKLREVLPANGSTCGHSSCLFGQIRIFDL